jgi:prepilin-type N-terminal cleavage/methylation domain-containing protein
MSRRPQGFTLLEVLIALAIFGLLLAALVAMLRVCLSMVGRQVTRIELVAEEAPVREYLEALIGDARPTRFEGSARSLILVASSGPQGLQTIRLDLVRSALQVTGISAEPLAATAALSQTLLSPLTALRFRYFGRLPAGAAATWHSEWHAMPNLPALVGVSWTLAGHDPQPELLIAPRASGAVSGG